MGGGFNAADHQRLADFGGGQRRGAGQPGVGLLVAGFGYPVVFVLNVATYLAAALLILPLRMVENRNPARAGAIGSASGVN